MTCGIYCSFIHSFVVDVFEQGVIHIFHWPLMNHLAIWLEEFVGEMAFIAYRFSENVFTKNIAKGTQPFKLNHPLIMIQLTNTSS